MKKITLALITIVVIMIILMIKNEQIILTLETKSYVITNDYITDTLFKELNYESLYTYSSGVEELSNLYNDSLQNKDFLIKQNHTSLIFFFDFSKNSSKLSKTGLEA